MAEPKVQVDWDLSLLYTELDARADEITSLLREAVTEACPVDTGYMKSTIDVSKGENEITLYVGASYAPFTEYKPNTTCTGWFSNAIMSKAKEIESIWTKT